jgi:hypothetical protein
MDKMSQLKKEIKLTETGAESTKNLEEMRTLYRLVFRDGDHGAWDDDIERIRKYAKFFGAEIESRKFNV